MVSLSPTKNEFEWKIANSQIAGWIWSNQGTRIDTAERQANGKQGNCLGKFLGGFKLK